MKKVFLSLIILLMSNQALAYKDYSYEIQQAQRSCELERGSLLRDRQGTPACNRVNQLMRQQRDADRRRSNDQFYDSYNRPQTVIIENRHEPQKVIIENRNKTDQKSTIIRKSNIVRKDGSTWNNALQQYCIHNEAGRVISCE